MRSFLKNNRVLVGEIITAIISFIWLIKSDFDLEPLLLFIISCVGISYYFFGKSLEIPKLEVDFVLNTAGGRSAPTIIEGVSPMNENRTAYIRDENGIYEYRLSKRFEIFIRNQSQPTAFVITIYFKTPEGRNFTIQSINPAQNSLNSTEYKEYVLQLQIQNQCTRHEADQWIVDGYVETLNEFEIVIQYQDNAKKLYYTHFSLGAGNTRLRNLPSDIENFRIT